LDYALSSSSDDDGDPLSDTFSIADFSDSALRQAEREVHAFEEGAAGLIAAFESELLSEGVEPAWTFTQEDLGSDFWLTRNRHGSGFWDRPGTYGELAPGLSSLSHAAGERSVYVDTDEELRFSPDPDYRRAAGKLKLVRLDGIKVDQQTKYKQLQRCALCGRELLHTQYVVFGPPQEYWWLPQRHMRPEGTICSNEALPTWR
jgi:hypothetical protein